LVFSLLGSKTALSAYKAIQSYNYFPNQIFSDNKKVDDLVRNWYSQQLSALEELSLYQPNQKFETYRFTWLQTFHNPMAFSISLLEDGSGILTVKRCNGAGGYEPGVIDLKKEVELSKLQIQELIAKLGEMKFLQKPPNLDSMVFDGAHWVVEANLNGKYKIVRRQSGTDHEIQAWGLQLITLSGVDVGEIY
jgi:hypothetical protein